MSAPIIEAPVAAAPYRSVAGRVQIPDRVAERAATRYVVVMVKPELGLGPCHVSKYSTASHGYAQIGWTPDTGKMTGTTAHRAAWVHHNGPIPEGMTVDHRCRHRPCVRAEHLRLLPNLDNATDNGMIPVNQGVGRMCTKGHEMVQGKGRPYCRTCKNERRRGYRSAARERREESV